MRSNPAWLVVWVCALGACGSSASKDKDPKDKQPPPANQASEAAKPVAGSGAAVTADGKSACEALRPLLAGVDREMLDRDPWLKGQPETKKMMALDEGVAAAIGVCIADHWSDETIQCIVNAKDGTAEHCGLPRDEDRRADAATEAVYTRIFGARP